MTDINDVIKTIDELIDGGVLTQYAIAREAGISDGTLSAFRKGKYKGDIPRHPPSPDGNAWTGDCG